MRLHWTPEARAQLHAIQEHIAQESPKAAHDVIARLATRAEQLTNLPHLGKKVPDYNRDDLRQLSTHPYLLIYRVMTDQIDIISVMHMRQLLPRDWQLLGQPKRP